MSLLNDINEAVPTTTADWDISELKAWKERFPKSKSSTVKEFRAEFSKYQYRRQDDVVSLKLGEGPTFADLLDHVKGDSLLELVTSAKTQTDLKKSDATDAGASDVIDKAKAGGDISFSLMRNTINANGGVTGSDVANYIEKAEELNDEVDTVPFGLETDDGQIVKVYVNAEQADAFEDAMKQMLGMEDDIEEAINRLTTEFDIVDVVWPTAPDGEGEDDPDADLTLDDTANLELDPEDEQDFADDNYDVIAAADAKADKKKDDEGDDEIDTAAAADAEGDTDAEETDGDSDAKGDEEDDKEEGDDEESDDSETDEDGKPKKKKKRKKKAQPPEPVEDEETPAQEGLTPKGRLLVEEKEHETDSPSIAAAIKKMTSKGLHIKAMDEGDNNTVYIEDDKGDEYVMRNDRVLTKEKHGKKLTSYKKSKTSIEETEQEKNMTLGSNFLARVLQEAAPEDKDGVKDGFNIPLDSQARALTAKLKLPFAKRLIAFHVMCGVPGRYLNSEDAEDSIAGAADMLRKRVSVRRAFLALYDGLANAKGFAIKEPEGAPVAEAKDEDGNQKYTTYAAWKRALKKAYPESWIDGDADIANGMLGPKPFKRGETKGVGEWDGSEGWLKKVKTQVSEAKQKRGSFLQKLLETVLIELGLPQSLVTTTGPSAVGTGIYRTAELIEADAELERALRLLATRLGVKQTDAASQVEEAKKFDEKKPATKPAPVVGKKAPMLGKKMDVDKLDDKVKKPKRVAEGHQWTRLSALTQEAVDVGNDDFAQAVTGLVSALGIPDDVLERRRTQIVTALRQKKATLRNRAQVLTMIGRLSDIISKNTVAKGGQPDVDTDDDNATQGTTGTR